VGQRKSGYAGRALAKTVRGAILLGMLGRFLFFRYLQKERSDLLNFRADGNKWQIVHGWLRDRLED
jgi:hypothetical protein